MPIVQVVRSGGQSGADRAALDAARSLGIPVCGFVPAGGWAENATKAPGVLARYPELQATKSSDPAVRTRLNVEHSDATIIVWTGAAEVSAGTELTAQTARALARPVLVVTTETAPSKVVEWIQSLGLGLDLNIAGPRESEDPGLYEAAKTFLTAVLRDLER